MNNGMRMRMISERMNERQEDYSPQNDRRWTITENGMPYNEAPNMGGYSEYGSNSYGRMEYEPQYSEYGRGNHTNMYAPNMGGYSEYGSEMRMGYDMPESRRYQNGRFAPKSMMHMPGGQQRKMQIGFAGTKGDVMPFNQMTAEKWVRSMQGADGSHGAKCTMDQAKMVMEQIGCDCDPWEFYAAINAMYSDYGEVLNKFGLGDNMYAVGEMAKAFIEDKDAQPEKLARYYQYIVKH